MPSLCCASGGAAGIRRAKGGETGLRREGEREKKAISTVERSFLSRIHRVGGCEDEEGVYAH